MVKTNPALQGKKVEVLHKGKLLHRGVVLGEDEIFKDTILVGLTETTVSSAKPVGGNKYISIFRARSKDLKVI